MRRDLLGKTMYEEGTEWVMGPDPTANLGWKIHISPTPAMALNVAKMVLPILRKANVAFKIIGKLPRMRGFYNNNRVSKHGIETILNRNLDFYTLSQRGKFIAIYPENDEQANLIANEINDAFVMQGMVGPKYFIPCLGDIQVGSTGGIFTRWCIAYNGKDENRRKEENAERIFPFINMKSIPTKNYMCGKESSEITRMHPFDLDLCFLEEKLDKEIKNWGFHDLNTFNKMGILSKFSLQWAIQRY
jgi:hypothetical protein